MSWQSALLISTLLAACTPYRLTVLPAIDAAAALPEPDRPQLVARAVDHPATCYAFVDTVDAGTRTLSAFVLRAKSEDGVPLPDFAIWSSGPKQFAGSTGTTNFIPLPGLGPIAFSSSTAIYQTPQRLFFFRASPVFLDLDANEQQMVLAVGEDVRKSGIQEGDTLLSVDGAVFSRKAEEINSEWQVHQLECRPGQEVELIWIRPGQGRMSGTAVLAASKQVPKLPDDAYRDGTEAKKVLYRGPVNTAAPERT